MIPERQASIISFKHTSHNHSRRHSSFFTKEECHFSNGKILYKKVEPVLDPIWQVEPEMDPNPRFYYFLFLLLRSLSKGFVEYLQRVVAFAALVSRRTVDD